MNNILVGSNVFILVGAALIWGLLHGEFAWWISKKYDICPLPIMILIIAIEFIIIGIVIR